MEFDRGHIDDTRREVRRVLVERWRCMTPAEKGALVSGASRAVHRFHLAGLRLRHPRADARELELRSAVQRLGRAVVAGIVGEDTLPPPG